jgi:hypothetical protein
MRGRELGRAALAGAVLLATVAGCDTTVQEQLGLGKRAPDEFQVVRRAPLVIPPDYALRPPGEGGGGGAVARAQPDPSAEAREILTGGGAGPAETAAPLSEGERALVAASPVAAEPGIRDRIVAEAGELERIDRRLFLYIFDFQRRQFEPRDQVVDPAAEAARLRAGGTGGPGTVVTVRTGSTPLPAAP